MPAWWCSAAAPHPSARPLRRPGRGHLPAGSTVAIVGENGAGKTSLVKLLCGFYQPADGVVLVNEVDLRRVSPAAWRERIAVGCQDFVRFELPARQTVGVGDLPRLDDETAVRAALDYAGAIDILDQLDDGLDTHLGKAYAAGVELSSTPRPSRGGLYAKLVSVQAEAYGYSSS